MSRWQSAAALAAVTAAAAPVVGQAGAALELSAVRFYRSASRQTLVEAFCRVPLAVVAPLGGGSRGDAAYRVTVSVRDSAGSELVSQSWSQAVAGEMLRRRSVSTVEHFRFAAQPGRYVVEVAITDSATGRVSRRRTDLSTFAAAPQASDLLLASGMREAADVADTVTRDGEVRKGSLFLETAGRPVLTPQRSELSYYLELYTERAESVTVRVRVRTSAGNEVTAAAPQRVAFPAGGGATKGVVDLGGLPPGDYQLEVALATPDSEVVRTASFGMAGFETEAAAMAAVAPFRDMFAALNEAQLDSVYGPLLYLMTAEEHGIYSTLTVEGKRSFLRKFWSARDPTPGTPQNEALNRFYAAIAEANRRFREGGAGEVDGWRTDRGRIFIRYGSPDEVLSRPQAGSTRPYEVWKYTRVRPRKFVFFDATAFGHYELIWTDERREPSRPNWQQLLGPEAVEDVERF